MPKPNELPEQALDHIPDHVLEKHPELAPLLAVAFTDVDGNHTYEPNKDLLISALRDTNNDGTVSAGDTIQWGTYPTSFDGSTPRGTYTSADVTISFGIVENAGASAAIAAFTETGLVIWNDQFFFDDFGNSIPQNQVFETGNSIFDIDSLLLDGFPAPNGDTISVQPVIQGPGQPDTVVVLGNSAATANDGWLEVAIFV
jgi:hypothetical protein